MTKLSVALRIPLKIKNWTLYFLDYMGRVKNKRIVYELRNGLKYSVRAGSSDRGIINEIIIENDYMPQGFEIHTKDIVVDVGAQIGIFSIYAASKANKGKVYAFEPLPENFNILNENSELNHVKNLISINKALYSKNGKESIFIDDINTGGHSLINTMKTKHKLNITTISFNDFIKTYKIKKIDFLKMDCEGSEYEIFFKASKKNIDKIKKISMEYHNLDANRNVDKLKTFFERNGFNVEVLTHPRQILYAKRT